MARIIFLLVLLPWRLLAQAAVPPDTAVLGATFRDPARPDTVRLWAGLKLIRTLGSDAPALRRRAALGRQVLTQARRLRHPGLQNEALDELRLLAEQTSQWAEELGYCQQLLSLAQQQHRPDWLASAYYGLAGLYFNTQNMPEARRYAEQADALQRRYPVPATTQATVLSLLTNIYLEQHEPALARQTFRRALPAVRSIDKPLYLYEFNLLAMYGNGLRLAQPDSALRYLQPALALAQRMADPYALAYVHMVLMQTRKTQGRWADVRAEARQAIRYARRTDTPDYEAEALAGLAESLRHLGPTAAAYDTLRLAQTLLDTLEAQSAKEALAALQVRYGTERQQARIRVLGQQRRISQLRAAQEAGRARQYALVAGSLLLLLLGGGALLGLLLRSRRGLQASEAALRQAHGTQQELMRIIGHDLRGPVALFQQMTPLLREAVAPAVSADADELVGELDASAQHLGALVDNLLDWARLQGNLVRYAPVRLRAAAAVLGVTQLYEPVARRKGVVLTTAVDEALLVWADLDLLATVLRNLLGNAIKYTPPGAAVRVAAAGSAAGVVFSVTDAGQGMSAEALAAVLRAERVVSARGTGGEPGTGLGLGLCQRFVALMGGELHGASNADGPGMRFWFVLPVFVG